MLEKKSKNLTSIIFSYTLRYADSEYIGLVARIWRNVNLFSAPEGSSWASRGPLLDPSWEHPGGFLGAPGRLLGLLWASWAPPGSLLGASWEPPEDLLGAFWSLLEPPGRLLGLSVLISLIA